MVQDEVSSQCVIRHQQIRFQRLFAENKEKLITGALSALVISATSGSLPPRELEAQFHALRRLCASKVGFAAFTALPG
jgi:DnaJ homolog subfamily C member 13